MIPGDPTPRSPYDVLADRAYRFIESKAVAMRICLTVLHGGTETYWQTTYLIGSSFDRRPAQWYRVEPVQVTRLEWRPVG